MLVNGVPPVSAVTGAGQADLSTTQTATNGSHFLDLIDTALQNVSTTQNQATQAESGFAVGAPGATLGRALVASDRAQIAWNATVAVRNEVVAAYQSVMSMQF
jgi:flagellar hook-basal body complex protein FliE